MDVTKKANRLTNYCAILIAVINQVITFGIVKIMENVGMRTHSRKSSLIAFCVFFLQFLNTGVLLLLVTANFKEQGIDPYHLLHGSRTDFGMQWYSQTGDLIVESMIVSNIVMPYVLALLQWFTKKIKILKDQRKGPFKIMSGGGSGAPT